MPCNHGSRGEKKAPPLRTAPDVNGSATALLTIFGRRSGAALGDFRLELLVVVVGDVDPGVAHLVDGAIAPADPLIGIGIRLVVLGVVIPREEVEDRPL